MYGLLKKKVIPERISLISTGWAMLVLQALSLMHISQVSSHYTLERGQILCFFTGTEYFALSQCSNLGPMVFWWLFQEFFTQTTQLYWQFSLPSPPATPFKKTLHFPTANLTVNLLCIVLLQGDQKTSQRQIWLISPETVKSVKKIPVGDNFSIVPMGQPQFLKAPSELPKDRVAVINVTDPVAWNSCFMLQWTINSFLSHCFQSYCVWDFPGLL